MKAKILEDEGKLTEAGELLQEVQVETIGSLEAAEKIEFILNHFRITLDSKDFVRAYIIARKITERSLAQDAHQVTKKEKNFFDFLFLGFKNTISSSYDSLLYRK